MRTGRKARQQLRPERIQQAITVARAKRGLCWKVRNLEQHDHWTQSLLDAMLPERQLATSAQLQESPAAREVACSCYAAHGAHGPYQASEVVLARSFVST